MSGQRCRWVSGNDALYAAYHDTEWGVPEYDSRALWEKLMLDGFQAGLAWITILRKRETMREAFHGFDPEIIARYTEADHARLMANPGINRSNAKIQAAIGNARAWLDMREAGTDFSDYLWSHVGGAPIQNTYTRESGLPTHTELSTALSKDLKKRGFKFVGPVIVYAFMEAVGCVPFFLNRAMTFIATRALPAKMPSEGLPARLYHRRRELRLTKVEVAKTLGVTPGIIRRWEEAEHPPSAKHVPAIVEFLGDDDWLEAGSFCQRLARFRKLRGWSQLQLSQSLDCAESSVRMWERGVRPSRSMRSRIEGHICA